jgi:HK97 family phage major capsid protein
MEKELMEKLEAAETVEEINEVKAEIEAAKAREEAIAEKSKLLNSFKAAEPKSAPKEAKTLGEFAVKNLDLSAMRSGASKSAGTGFLFKAATDAHTAPAIAEVTRRVVDINKTLGVRDLFGAEQISGNALTYFQMGATEAVSGGAPKTVAQGATKPQFHVPYTPVTVPLQKIAGWFYETDELLSDAAFLASTVDNRGLFELANAVEAYLGGQLLATSGIQAATYASTLSADDIFAAMMSVKTATGYDADAIMINPTDYQALRIAKDSNLQYYGGGYFYAPYGNGQVAEQPGIWGLKTVVTTAVAAGTVLVGAFRAGASVVTKSGEGASIEVHRGDHDDAINNRVTVVVEERVALAVRVPSAFVKISKAS